MGRIANAVRTYNRMRSQVEHLNDGRRYRGLFYADDVCELWAMKQTAGPGNLSMMLFNALQAGWVIGYRAGQRTRKGPDLPPDHGALEPVGAVLERELSRIELTKTGKSTGGEETAQ